LPPCPPISGNPTSLVLATLFIPTTHSFTTPHRTSSLQRLPTKLSANKNHRRGSLPESSSDESNKPSWQQNAEYWAARSQEELTSPKSNNNKPARNKVPAPAIGDHIGFTSGHRPVDRSPWDEDNGNTFAHLYNEKSTDEFKLPFENQRDIVERMERNTRCKDYTNEYEVVRRDVTENGSVPEWFGKGSVITAAIDIVDDGYGMKSAQDGIRGQLHDKSSFQTMNRNDFRRPYNGQSQSNEAVPEWFGSNTRSTDNKAVPVNSLNNAAVNPYGEEGKQHSFQMSSTDDFRKPYGTPPIQPSSSSLSNQQTPRIAKRIFNIKAPFQTSTTDDFKRVSDTGTSFSAPQQPLYAEFTKSSRTSQAWENSVGQDSYESTQLPHSVPLGGIVDKEVYKTNPSQSSAVLTVENEDNGIIGNSKERRRVSNGSSDSEMLVRSIQWVDPADDAMQYPLLLTRMFVTVLATVSTRHLHLVNGFSPVLASSVLSFLVSTCYDKRLGQVALCGALAGMSGGHLMPTMSMALLMGVITSFCYEILIGMNNLFAGIGGRVGAVAFLASGIMAKYQRVNCVGRKMRRGVWKAGVGPSNIVVTMMLFHAVGALATILLRQSSKDDGVSDPVRASSVVGIIGSLVLSNPTSLMALYGGSFVGMSLPSRLMHGNLSRARIRQSAASLMLSFAGGGVLAGLIHAATIHGGYWLGGWGGKAGLCAFAGCWVYRGLENLIRFKKR